MQANSELTGEYVRQFSYVSVSKDEEMKQKIAHMHWEAIVDFENEILNGKVTFTIETFLQELILDTKELEIHSIHVNQEEVEIVQKMDEYSEALGIPLCIAIPSHTICPYT